MKVKTINITVYILPSSEHEKLNLDVKFNWRRRTAAGHTGSKMFSIHLKYDKQEPITASDDGK